MTLGAFLAESLASLATTSDLGVEEVLVVAMYLRVGGRRLLVRLCTLYPQHPVVIVPATRGDQL